MRPCLIFKIQDAASKLSPNKGEKKSKVLIAYANNFFAKLVSLAVSRLSPDADRERVRFVKSVVFGNEEGKKVILELLPLFASNNATTNFLTHVKLGRRI